MNANTAVFAGAVTDAINDLTGTSLFAALRPLIAIVGVIVFITGLWKLLRSKAGGGGGGMGGGGGGKGGLLGSIMMMVLGVLIIVPELIGLVGDGMVGIVRLFIETVFTDLLNL